MVASVTPRVLLAALGSTLRGDDGFGPALLAQIRPLVPPGVDAIDFGTQGLALVQKLYDAYEALVVLDACVRGQAPGTIYVMVPDVAPPPRMTEIGALDAFADAHVADPSRILTLARTLGVLPRGVWLIGCEPHTHDDYDVGLSDPVARALGTAERETLALLQDVQRTHARHAER